MLASTSPRKATVKALEAKRQAKARADAGTALAPLLIDQDGHDRKRMSDAILDEALDLHASIHHPAETARKVCGWAGRNHPDVERAPNAAAQFEALFRKVRAA